MSDKVAMMLAKITAGTTLKPPITSGPGGSRVNEVMAALGMGHTGLWGSSLLLGNYADDQGAADMAVELATRWAWLTWLKTGSGNQAVCTRQMKKLATMAVQFHFDPESARQTTLKGMATIVGVNHHTFRSKYRRHFHRLQAEIQYREQEAITALQRHL